MVVRSRARDRTEVRLWTHASARHQRELEAFARYCIQRLERDLGTYEAWLVEVVPSRDCFRSRVAARDRAIVVEASGTGHDGVLAIWDALCRVEERLREQR